MKTLTYVEIDVDYCSLTYGTAPCTASIPTTGADRCYNTKRTCQDRAHYTNSTVTLRFALPSDYLPTDIDCMPCIKSVSHSPATLAPGESMGTRATFTVTLSDHRHSDTGPGNDKYHALRSYNPYDQGTFWGRFRARQPYLFGKPIRLIRGVLGQALEDMETWHFVIASSSGPDTDGVFTLTAKDALKLADNSKAQAPALSTGYLASDIASGATSATLSPTGIGDEEYPASGWVCIGGEEVCAFTRSGNSLTLTRGQFNTVAAAHSAQDRVQLVLRFDAESPADIISELLQDYASVPSEYIPLADWQAEIDAYLQTVYSAVITEPTGVQDMIAELIEQAALIVWWDPAARLIRLRVIREIPTTAYAFDAESTLEGSVSIDEQPDKRLSQVWTYFAQRNPTKSLTDKSNYASCASTIDLEAEADYGGAEVKEIFSRWIPTGGRATALRLNALQLGRYVDPPRRISFDAWRHGDVTPQLGVGYNFESWPLQTAAGVSDPTPIQIVRLDLQDDKYRIEAEEMLFTDYISPNPDEHYITIDVSTNNVNLRTLHDTLFPEPTASTNVFLTIETGVTVGSTSTSTSALDVGSWPSGATVTITNNGRIQGCGGAGGHGDDRGGVDNPTAGSPGGTAFYTRYAVAITNNGQMWGGGGGGGGGSGNSVLGVSTGGGGGGGGGSGTVGGAGGERGYYYGDANLGTNGLPGTSYEGGAGGLRNHNASWSWEVGDGGDGGGPGLPGQQEVATGVSPGAAGGAAGAYVDGSAYVTWTATGDRRGAAI